MHRRRHRRCKEMATPKESTFRWKPTKDSDVYLERTLDLEKILSGREVRSARIIIKILHHGIQVYIVEADMNNCTPYGTCRSKAKPERVLVFEDISLAKIQHTSPLDVGQYQE